MKLAEKLLSILNEVDDKKIVKKEVIVTKRKNGKLGLEYRKFSDASTFKTVRRLPFEKHDEIKEYIDLYNSLTDKSLGVKQLIDNRKKLKSFPDNDFYNSIKTGTFKKILEVLGEARALPNFGNKQVDIIARALKEIIGKLVKQDAYILGEKDAFIKGKVINSTSEGDFLMLSYSFDKDISEKDQEAFEKKLSAMKVLGYGIGLRPGDVSFSKSGLNVSVIKPKVMV